MNAEETLKALEEKAMDANPWGEKYAPLSCSIDYSLLLDAITVIAKQMKRIEDLEKRVAIASPDVIHCNNCKHYEAFTQSCNIGDGIMLPDFYCANAESREGEQEGSEHKC